jgi:hypothetical protein
VAWNENYVGAHGHAGKDGKNGQNACSRFLFEYEFNIIFSRFDRHNYFENNSNKIESPKAYTNEDFNRLGLKYPRESPVLPVYKLKTEYLKYLLEIGFDKFKHSRLLHGEFPKKLLKNVDSLFKPRLSDFFYRIKSLNHPNFQHLFDSLQSELNGYIAATSLSKEEKHVLKLLNALLSSSMLESTSKNVLTLNIESHVRQTLEYVDMQKQLDQENLAQFYKENFEYNLRKKIQDSTILIENLRKDIQDDLAEQNQRISKTLHDIHFEKYEILLKQQTLVQKREELQFELIVRKVFEYLDTGASFICLLGRQGAAVGGILKSVFLISAETFLYTPSHLLSSLEENEKDYLNFKEKLNDTVQQTKSSKTSQGFDAVLQSNKIISDIFKGKSKKAQDR